MWVIKKPMSRTLVLVLLLIATRTEARNINWKEAIKLAAENSLEYQAALANYTSVQALEMGNLTGFLPKLTATATGTHSGAPATDSTHSYTAQLTLSQNLFAGFSDYNLFYLKRTNTQSALATFLNVRSRLSQELKQAYAELYYIQDYKKLVTDILRRRVENNSNVKLQYNVGRENKGSLLLSQSYVDSAEFDLLTTMHSEEIFIGNLKRILGGNSEETLFVTENISKEELAIKNPDFNKIAEQHPDVRIAKFDEEQAFYNKRISFAQFLPSLDFSGSYSYSGAVFMPDQDRWSLGLTLSIPLFEGLKSVSAYKSAQAKLEGGRFTALNTLLKVTNTLKQTFYSYSEAIQKEKIDESFRQAAILRAEVARNKYKNGFISFEAWDTVEADLITRQKEILFSEKNRIIKQSLWEQAQSIGVFQ